jgi:hypothetical protein
MRVQLVFVHSLNLLYASQPIAFFSCLSATERSANHCVLHSLMTAHQFVAHLAGRMPVLDDGPSYKAVLCTGIYGRYSRGYKAALDAELLGGKESPRNFVTS